MEVQVRATNAEGTGAWSEASSAPRDICGRTAIVVDAIVAATPAQDSCDTVLPRDMAALTELDITSRPGFYSLKVGDFAGLGGLTTAGPQRHVLAVVAQRRLRRLGRACSTLDLSGTSLRSLPSGAFDGLDSLTRLYLSDTSLQSLPSGAFAGSESLITLDLSDNWLLDTSDWPVRPFDGLDSLQILRLANTGAMRDAASNSSTPTASRTSSRASPICGCWTCGPATPLLGVPRSFLPLTSLETYNGEPYTRPADPPRNLGAFMGDINTSIMVDERVITGFETVDNVLGQPFPARPPDSREDGQEHPGSARRCASPGPPPPG